MFRRNIICLVWQVLWICKWCNINSPINLRCGRAENVCWSNHFIRWRNGWLLTFSLLLSWIWRFISVAFVAVLRPIHLLWFWCYLVFRSQFTAQRERLQCFNAFVGAFFLMWNDVHKRRWFKCEKSKSEHLKRASEAFKKPHHFGVLAYDSLHHLTFIGKWTMHANFWQYACQQQQQQKM